VHEEFDKLAETYNIVERFKDVVVSNTPEVEVEDEEDDEEDEYQGGYEQDF
jgi:hypothetical protein